MYKIKLIIAAMFMIAIIWGCSEETVTNPPDNTQGSSTTIYDLPADAGLKPKMIVDLPADSGKTGHFTFYSFKDTTIVPLSDSNTTKWDIGLMGTTIILNSGVRGPGSTTAIVLRNTSFDAVTEAPESGYVSETQLVPTAIPTGSDAGWYHYDDVTFTITPKTGVVIVIKTTDGKYLKMEILSYYKGNPPIPDQNSISRFYTIRYAYQGDGSRDLTSETGHFTFFRLSDSTIVQATDSATTKWDLGFRSTSIILNSGVRGPGNVGVIIMRVTTWSSVTEAPEAGYVTETQLTPMAIPSGSDNGWYHYDGDKMIITAIPGVVFVLRTADGKYAKFQILNYYKGNPEVIDPYMPARYFTFKYVYQPDGTRNLKVE